MDRLHTLSAAIIFAFLSLHFSNHLIGLQGLEAYERFMSIARVVYRHPIVELVVLLAFVVQLITGAALCKSAWARGDFIHRLYTISGITVGAFLLIHLAVIALFRFMLNADTGFHFAAAQMLESPYKYLFIPLYGLGVFGLFVHLGCIGFSIISRKYIFWAYSLLLLISAAGAWVCYTIYGIMTGQVFPIEIAPDHLSQLLRGF